MDGDSQTRRSFLSRLAAAAGLAGLAAQGGILVRSCVPNVTYDSPSTVKIGLPESFADGLTFLPAQRLFIVRDSKVFRAVSAVCTHLGCTVHADVQQLTDGPDPGARPHLQVQQFSCPCHGSRYRADGTNISGPAPRPLARYRLALAPDDGQLVVNLTDEVGASFVLTLS
ncbi:MAG: ubiquinol-cytochrome c reductase iron-sulfur subunit [Acidobacteria bacterium]|nr:ubiquinol-cytochrome c reductase iron-sulfur subunit [Acidobacteriota bacterium]